MKFVFLEIYVSNTCCLCQQTLQDTNQKTPEHRGISVWLKVETWLKPQKSGMPWKTHSISLSSIRGSWSCWRQGRVWGDRGRHKNALQQWSPRNLAPLAHPGSPADWHKTCNDVAHVSQWRSKSFDPFKLDPFWPFVGAYSIRKQQSIGWPSGRYDCACSS